MIYPDDFEIRIAFDRIRSMIEERCITALAKEKLSETKFETSYEEIKKRLSEGDEMRTILMMEPDFPSGGYVDINLFLKKIRIEGTWLDTLEIGNLRTGLITIRDLVRFFLNKEEQAYPALHALATGITLFPTILERIDFIVDRFGNIKDNASPELQIIRRELGEKSRQINKRLMSILRNAQSQGIVEADTNISIREGRAVIPVAAANKRKLKGFIHDKSATGKTAYIEPIEVVELNNEIKELEYSERREIIRILIDFATFLRPYTQELIDAGDFLSTIDFIKAKTSVALDMNAINPILLKEPHIELRNARHPLLEKTLRKEGKPIVPLNMHLNKDKHILVISGPNAGGKSVCLKTVGLLQYMLQCGLLIPVGENSEMGIFKDIFVDIGDQQSIDNDLSTYSSHLQNMKTMLRYSSSQSLVLIDEFGTGTEPAMGGAIAETILERLERKKVFGVITTHYSNLKYYASNAKGILNGAMTFDVQNIRPLFNLEIGKPGSSFAFEIARKIGLPEEIVKEAQEKVGNKQVNMEKQLREIARDKRYWENKRERIRIAEKRTDDIAEKYEKELSEIIEQRNRLIKEAKEQAANIVAEANRQIENTIREIKEAQAEKERTKQARAKLEQFKNNTLPEQKDEKDLRIEEKMKRLREKEMRRAERKEKNSSEKGEQKIPPVKKKEVEAGDKVRIKGQNIAGEVLKIEGSKATVIFGQLSTTIDIKRLEPISNTEYKRQQKDASSLLNPLSNPVTKTSGYDVNEKRLNFSSQIDLRGMRVDEALGKVQEFIDEAIMLGITDVKILHGKGTGALKEEIRKLLRTIPFIISATDEHEQFGGAGITVVKIDA